MPGYKMHVVSHTHWDREFYLPFQEFRMRLVDLIDRLVEILDKDPEFKYYHLDGQTIILEDYLEIKPGNRARLKEYAKQGRILVGPKYQLNDHFLVSGEAHIRNFIVGIRMAEEFGDVMRIGYCADEFGLISQYPQILRGFDIDNAIFGRGIYVLGDRKMECIWESPDGSRVLSSVMAMWFNNAQRVPTEPDEIDPFIARIKDFMTRIAATPHLLLMNGVDHLAAQPDVALGIRRIGERLKDGDTICHSTMPEYIEAIRQSIAESGFTPQVFRGELREDNWGHMLAGTLSTRIYLKQRNERAQTQLERYTEPASSFAWSLGMEYPWHKLDYAWRLLMKNHPHDSICGCSCDEAHREMESRFMQVQQIADKLSEHAFDYLADQIDTESESLVVFNPLSWTRTDKVRANIDFPLNEPFRGLAVIDPSLDVAAIKLYDSDGKPIPFTLVDVQQALRQVIHPRKLTHGQTIRRFVIEFIAEDVPAIGYKTYKIVKAERTPEAAPPDIYKNGELNNGLVRAFVENGALSVQLLSDEKVFSNLNSFEDVGDIGDEYRHIKPKDDTRILSNPQNTKVSVAYNSPITATIKIEQAMKLPESAAEDCSARSEKLVPCNIISYITVTRGIPRIDIRTEIENNVKDHRLRALFPTGVNTDVSHAESQFDVVTRPIKIPEDWDKKLASTFRPQLNWVDINDGKSGLCVINKGLPEYELYDDENRTLGLTLLRCVANLAGLDVEHINKPTPDAQCLGKHVFEYSIYPHIGSWQDAKVWIQAYLHNAPLHATQTGEHAGQLSSESGFVQIEPTELILSAVKKAEKDDRLIVRFFNTTDGTVEGKITVRGAKSAEITNMNEEPKERLSIADDGSVMLKVTGKKIVTLGFGF
ncbi:MAG: glycoside hydrolase family 38 C-terminal domain-containing protein [Armatimonadota bacterium]|nr:glycoside hydrolase family 38 C-terminal domain-containing protein [Armatimonadota bacterium]